MVVGRLALNLVWRSSALSPLGRRGDPCEVWCEARGPGKGVQRLGTRVTQVSSSEASAPWIGGANPTRPRRAGGSRLRGQAQSHMHSRGGADLRGHGTSRSCLYRLGVRSGSYGLSGPCPPCAPSPKSLRLFPISQSPCAPSSQLFVSGIRRRWGEKGERRPRGGSERKVGIGAGQEGGEKRGREERAARARRGGREPRSAAPAPASGASRAAARRGPSRDGLARGLPLLLLPRPAAPPPRRAPPAGE